MFTRIVVANDGSEGGFKALAMACELAKREGAALHMISVEELPDFPASIDEIVEIKDAENHKYHDVLERARAIAKASDIDLNAEVSLPATPRPLWWAASKRLKPICWLWASWDILRSMSASSAGPRTASCASRRVRCWSSSELASGYVG